MTRGGCFRFFQREPRGAGGAAPRGLGSGSFCRSRVAFMAPPPRCARSRLPPDSQRSRGRRPKRLERGVPFSRSRTCHFCSRPVSRKWATWPQLAAREAGTASEVGVSVPSSSLEGSVTKERWGKWTPGDSQQSAPPSAPSGRPVSTQTLPSTLSMRSATLRGHSPNVLSRHRVQPRLGSAVLTCPLLKARRDPSWTGTL